MAITMDMPIQANGERPYCLARLAALALLALAVCAGFVALGTWQVQRRAWKLDLIARVDARVHAAPTAAPGPQDWPSVTAARDEYRHVTVSGRFLDGADSFVQANTVLGPGYWVMTPLQTGSGFVVLIDRGFVPADRRAAVAPPAGPVSVTGLLRMTEPKGGFLRSNVPAEGRWYSRDVAAIAATHGLASVAPYFIDADAPARPGDLPVGGLTVVSFPNNHLVYALTWYSLALMVAGAASYIGRDAWRCRSRRRPV